eukprot:TRINITY_DN34792_c0_g1_i1.p1 TRINITY_DN34792_c0_g1~~TRINITY_DN34792_c0_g1_i1.p1  ORF type:complete len:296 (+),score=57.25 TRINITY_DN34792_c0_g1_i1:58-888(+)
MAVHMGLLILMFVCCNVAIATPVAHTDLKKKVVRKQKKPAMQIAVSAKGVELAETEYKYRWQPTNQVLCSVKGNCGSHMKLYVADIMLYDAKGDAIQIVTGSAALHEGSSTGCWTKYQESLDRAFDGDESSQTCFDIFDGTHGTALSFTTRTQVDKYSIVQTQEGQSAWIYFATAWNMFESTDGGVTWAKWQDEVVKDASAPTLLGIEGAENAASNWDNSVKYHRSTETVSEWGDCSAEGSVCASGLSCMWQNAWYAQCLTHCPGGDWGDCKKPAE